MSHSDPSRLLVALSGSEKTELLEALAAEDIEASLVDDLSAAFLDSLLAKAQAASFSDCILVLGEAEWASLRASLNPASPFCIVILVLPRLKSKEAAELAGPAAFDCVFSGFEGWARNASIYIRVLLTLSRRFSGGISLLERRYENLVHSLPDIVYELDSAGRFTFLNSSIKLLGYDPEDLLGMHFSVLLSEEDAEVVDRDTILKSFRGVSTGPALSPKLFNERRNIDRKTENLEVRLRRKSGAGGDDVIASVLSYGEVTAAGEYSLRSEEPSFMGSVGVIRDITLRRKSEEMLRKLYQAVDQLSAGVLIADKNFRIEYVNPAFFKLAGKPPQDLIGAEVMGFFSFSSTKAQEIASLVVEGFDAQAEAQLEKGDGQRLWVDIQASPVRSPAGFVTHAILICEDISSRKAMEDLVKLAKDEAVRANAAKSDFLASMSHELKSPVASILAAARLIEMGGPDPERRAAAIIQNAQGLLGMLGDILDFVRFETGSATLRKYAFPLSSFIARVCDPYREKAEAKGLAFEIGSIKEETLRSDPDRLARSLGALLDNAITFTEQGHVRVDVEVERRLGNIPYLKIAVSDTGPGIQPEDQGRIFSPFVQLASPYTKQGGAGIGLSLARTIVRALGGELRLQSESGKGSIFSILVPADELSAGTKGYEETLPKTRYYRLLVVDDNEVNLEYMAALLTGVGHRVTTASSGADALHKLEEIEPDAAILDIQMPGMSGIDLGRKLRGSVGGRYDPDMPLVALTAFDPDEVSHSGVDFDGVFDKPVEVPKLLRFLDSAIDYRERPSSSALALRWAGRLAEGRKVLSASKTEVSEAAASLVSAVESGVQTAIKDSARVLGALLSRLGEEAGAQALKRLVIASYYEDKAVLACRAARLALYCERSILALEELFKGN